MKRWLRRLVPRDPRELVAIDLETTGLDAARAEVLAAAAVPIEGTRVRTSAALSIALRAVTAPALDSMRHHRLRPVDVAGGEEPAAALARFRAFLGDRALLGWCVAFDVAVLERALGARLRNRRIDLAHVFERAMRRRAPEREPALSLEAIATTLGVPLLDRHTALGDAATCAMCYVALRHVRRV